jgi:hypothetical protein
LRTQLDLDDIAGGIRITERPTDDDSLADDLQEGLGLAQRASPHSLTDDLDMRRLS